MSAYQESTLKNGLKVLTYEDTSASIAEVRLVFKAGSRYEEPHQRGYAHILEHMLLKGTVKRPSPVLFAKEVDDKGGYKNAFTSLESFSMLMRASDEYVENLIELVSDALFNSLLDPKTLENEKSVIIQELKKSDDNVDSFFSRYRFEKLFAGHPLSNNALGDSESIKSASSEELKKYKDKFLVPENAALIVSGSVSHDKAVALAQKYFSQWSGSAKRSSVAVKPPEKSMYFKKKDTSQTILSYNFYTVPSHEIRDLAALELLRNFLGFGGSSVLKEELRHKRGLIYNVGVGNFFFSDTGLFTIRTSTTKPTEALEVIKNVVANIKNLFTEDGLSKIKEREIGSFKLGMANLFNHADVLAGGFLAEGRLFTPEEYIANINGVSYEDIIKVIDTYLSPEKAIVVAMGPEDFSA